MPHELTAEDLEIFNNLVQRGLIEVASIDEFGEPSYQIASRFRNAAPAPGSQPEARVDDSFLGRSGK